MKNSYDFGEPSGGGFIDTHFDFARCQRPDGSFYGTGGQCRKGTPVDAKESIVTPKMRKAIEEGEPFAEGGFSELYMVDGKVVKVQEDAYLPDI